MKSILISAYTCDPTKGSEPGNGWKWASGIALRGYNVDLITTSKGKSGIESELAKSPIPNLQIHYVDHSVFWSKAYYWNFIFMYAAYWLWQRKIYNYVKKNIHEVDLVHHVTWGSLKIGTKLYKLDKPLLFGPVGGGQLTPLNYRAYLGKDFFKEKFRNLAGILVLKYNPFSRQVLKNARILVTNADTFNLVSKMATQKPKLIFDAAINKMPLISSGNRKENELDLLWVGRIYGFKGLRLILEALTLIEQEYLKKLHLEVVGDGPDRKPIEKLVKDLKLSSVVNFTGMIEYSKVEQYYEKSNVFIYTSLRDSFPGQILDAQLWGLPVITLDLHGQSLMVNASNGIKCTVDTPVKTVKEISEAILYLLRNPDKRQSMGKDAHEFAKEQTWDKKINSVVADFYPKN